MHPAPGRVPARSRRRSGLGFLLLVIWRNMTDAPGRVVKIVGAVAVGIALAIAIIAASEGIDTRVTALLDVPSAVDLRAVGINVAAVHEILTQTRNLLTKLAIALTAALVGWVTWGSMEQRRRAIALKIREGQRMGEAIAELVGESLVLCLVGGLVGVVFGRLLCALIRRQLPALPMSPSVRGALAIFPTTTALAFLVTTAIAIYFVVRQNPEPAL